MNQNQAIEILSKIINYTSVFFSQIIYPKTENLRKNFKGAKPKMVWAQHLLKTEPDT